MDISQIILGICAIAATVYGAIRGAKCGVILADERAKTRMNEAEFHEIENLRKALLVEIEVIEKLYMEGMGNLIESHPDSEAFLYIYPTGQRYFVVYEENAHLIGRIPNDNERNLIVKTYSQAKALLDSYHLNNSMAEKVYNAMANDQSSLGLVGNKIATDICTMMKSYTPALKQRHYDVMSSVKEFKKALQIAFEVKVAS